MGIPSQVAVLVTLALMEPLWHQPRVPTTVAVASKILAAALMGVRQRVLHAQAMAETFVPAAILVITFLAQVVPRTHAAAAMDKQRQEPPAPAMVKPFVLAAALGMSSLQVRTVVATPLKQSDQQLIASSITTLPLRSASLDMKLRNPTLCRCLGTTTGPRSVAELCRAQSLTATTAGAPSLGTMEMRILHGLVGMAPLSIGQV
jgi:hypothetical protein